MFYIMQKLFIIFITYITSITLSKFYNELRKYLNIKQCCLKVNVAPFKKKRIYVVSQYNIKIRQYKIWKK